MKVTVKGDMLYIEMPLNENGKVTEKGNRVVATSGGNKALATYKGKPLNVGVNAFIDAK